MKRYPFKSKYIPTDGSATATGRLMHRMVSRYHNDMLPYVHYTLPEVFALIACIPYREDPPDETIQRPFYTMARLGDGGDCDDKAIALASYTVLTMAPDPSTGLPYRFIAARRMDRDILHHVYTEVYLYGRYIPADCTYNFNCLGQERVKYAEKQII